MADFSDDISTMEKLAKSVAEKERNIVDALEIAEVSQAKAHLHQAYLVLNRISRRED